MKDDARKFTVKRKPTRRYDITKKEALIGYYFGAYLQQITKYSYTCVSCRYHNIGTKTDLYLLKIDSKQKQDT